MKPYQFIFKQNKKIQANNKTMKIYIENMNTIENRNKVYTTLWRKIYKVIEEDYFKESDIFPDYFIKKCKYNSNKDINIPIELKKNIK